MFKNVMAYKMMDAATIAAFFQPELDLTDVIDAHLSVPPHATSWRRFGFATSDMFGENGTYFTGALGARVFSIGLQERALPGWVINQKLAERILRLEELNGRYPHRKEIAELKDHVIAELLPQAPIKVRSFYVMAFGSWLFVEAGSAKTGDEICSFLRETLGGEHGLRLRPLGGVDTQAWLKRVAKDQELDEVPNKLFRHLGSAVLKSKTEGIVRLKDVDFDTDDVELVFESGRAVVELSVGWRTDESFLDGDEVISDDIQFTINDNLMLKRLKFSDILAQQAHDESQDESQVAWFDATVAIVADRLHKLVTHLAVVNDFSAVLEEDANLEAELTQDADESAEEGEQIDSLFYEAVSRVRESGICSISRIQRELRVGYNRAARIVEDMQAKGVVSGPDDKGYREVLPFSKADEDDEL